MANLEAQAPATDPVLALSVQREQVLDAIDAAQNRRDDDASLHARFSEIDARFIATIPTTIDGARRKLEFAAGIAVGSDAYTDEVGASIAAALSALGSPDAMARLDAAAGLCAALYGGDDPVTAAVRSALQRGPLAS